MIIKDDGTIVTIQLNVEEYYMTLNAVATRYKTAQRTFDHNEPLLARMTEQLAMNIPDR